MIEHVEFAQCLFFNAAETLHECAHPETLGSAITKRLDHGPNIYLISFSVIRQAYNARQYIAAYLFQSEFAQFFLKKFAFCISDEGRILKNG